MGTWGTGMMQDDYAADIIGEFSDLYNNGEDILEIRKILEKRYMDETSDNGYLFWLALAKGQWNIGALDVDVFNKVEEIVNSGIDAKTWKELGGDDADIAKRKTSLKNFLQQISTPREKPKKRVKKRLVNSPYEIGDVVTFKMANGNYGAMVIVNAEKQTQFGLSAITTLHINTPNLPTLEEISKCYVQLENRGSYKNHVAACNYYFSAFKKDANLFTKIGRIKVPKSPLVRAYAGGWSFLIQCAGLEFEYEKSHEPTERLTLKKYLGYFPWQKVKILENTVMSLPTT